MSNEPPAPTANEAGDAAAPAAVEWVSLPLLDESWTKGALLLAIVAAIALAGTWVDPAWGPLALVLLPIAVGPYLLPSRFRVGPEGVRVAFFLFNRERPWSAYRRYAVHPDGVFLATFDAPSRRDSFRGDFIRFTAATDRGRVMALVAANVRRHA